MSYVRIPLLPVDSRILASKPWWPRYDIWQNLQNLEVMPKYDFSNSDISSRVVPYLDPETSSGQDVSRVGQLVEGKSRPLCSLHRQKVTRCFTVN